MRLTRRDAVAALFAGGAVGALASGVRPDNSGHDGTDENTQFTDDEIRQLVAIAELVFPSRVDATAEYVAEYVSGLPPDRQRAISTTLDRLEQHVVDTRGASLVDLSRPQLDRVFRSLGVDRTGSSPDGTLPQQVRFYLVNQLLYGLYTTPRGTRLVGIENPVGYPGGYESYQQPPTDE